MSTPDELVRRAQSMGLRAEIVTAPATLPITEHHAIDASPGQVIVDASTLLAAVETLPVLIEQGLDEARRTRSEAEVAGTLSLIQAAVIHEKLWVDALTLARSSGGAEIAALLSPFLSGFLVTSEDVYSSVWSEVDSLRKALATNPVPDVAVDLSTVEWIDRRYHHPRDVVTKPTDCHQADKLILVHSNGRKHQELPNIPWELANSDSGFARTLFYLTMATKLSHVYAPHPDRAALLDRLSAREMVRSSHSFRPSRAEEVVRDVDSQLTDQFRTNQFDIGAPPIADYVCRKCKRLADLSQVIASVRQEAAEFRKWCAELEDAFRSGRPRFSKIQQMRAQLAGAKDAWKLNIEEGVNYESRKVLMTCLEKFVKIDGVTNRTVKDPVLWSRYKPLLFINSLYRSS